MTNNTSDFFFKDGVCPTDFSCFVWLHYGSIQHWWVGRCPSWQNKTESLSHFWASIILLSQISQPQNPWKTAPANACSIWPPPFNKWSSATSWSFSLSLRHINCTCYPPKKSPTMHIPILCGTTKQEESLQRAEKLNIDFI